MSERIMCDNCRVESYYDATTEIYCPKCYHILEENYPEALKLAETYKMMWEAAKEKDE